MNLKKKLPTWAKTTVNRRLGPRTDASRVPLIAKVEIVSTDKKSKKKEKDRLTGASRFVGNETLGLGKCRRRIKDTTSIANSLASVFGCQPRGFLSHRRINS